MPLPVHLSTVHDAISVAAGVARHFGLTVDEPVPLRSTNNAVAWLAPANVVAKVSVASDSRLYTELQVAKELSVLGAPVVSLAEELPAILHCRDGLEMTYWEYHAQSEIEFPAEVAMSALSKLHTSLDRLSLPLKASLPSYRDELSVVRSLLADQASLPALATADRQMLLTVFDRLRERLDRLAPANAWSVIHGSPHSYNMLLVGDEPAFIDFETTCFGPREWDLAHLSADETLQFTEPVRSEVLLLCRQMVNVKTATLCVTEIDRGDMREHAEFHLASIRAAFAKTVD